MICVYVKVSYEFMRVIFKDRCWVVHISFVGMVKFKFLAHFPVDHLAHPVVSSHSKSPQISRTLLSILVGLNNVVVWMVSTRPFISKSSSA